MDQMTVASPTLSVQDRYQHLRTVISSQRFLQKQGLGNEVPFFICPFPARDAVEMQRVAKQLTNWLATRGIVVLEIDLYDLSIDLLQRRGIWERLLEIEATVSKDQFKELLQGVLDPETHL